MIDGRGLTNKALPPKLTKIDKKRKKKNNEKNHKNTNKRRN